MSKREAIRSGMFCLLVAALGFTATASVAIGAPPDGGPSRSASERERAPLRDSWFVQADDGIVWGTLHVLVRAADDGGRSYESRSDHRFEFLGTPQRTTTRSRVVVDAALAPRWLECEVEQRSGATRIEGRREGDRFVVTIRRDGTETTNRIAIDEAPPLVADAALGDWLHRLPASVGSVELRLLDCAGGEAKPVTAQRTAHEGPGSRWRIDPGAVPGEMELRLDADGVAEEMTTRFPHRRVVRHPDASRIEPVHRALPDRELLLFAVDRPLPPQRRIESLAVALSWRDIDPALLDLEDARQSIRSIETNDGQTRAVVALGRAPEAIGDPTIPAADPALAKYLGTTDFIEPADPEIVRTAREIVGETTSARAAAEALCRWTASAIESVMIAETLSGPAVLRRRVGKCTEFATLYASLARSVGIPTRIALGQRLFPAEAGAQWGGHMWNEVWLGAWVPVDASAGEFGGSPALLKLVDSDSVGGTQEIRWLLTESLAVRIVEVGEEAIAEEGAVDGLHEGVWTSVERGFRIRLPEAAWTVDRRIEGGALVLRIRPPAESAMAAAGDGALLHLTAFDLPAGAPPRAVAQARLAQHRAALSSFELLADEPTEIAGANGHRLRFQGQARNGRSMRVTELLWSSDGTGCLLNLIADEALHDEWLPMLESIAGSFERLAPQP